MYPEITSLAKLLKLGFDGHDLAPLRERLLAQAPAPAALMDLCAVEQILGDPVSALQRQAEALGAQRIYRSGWPASAAALRVLAFLAAGEINANTPIDFLLQGTDCVLYSLYMAPGESLPGPIPDHDIAFVAVGESDRVRPILEDIHFLIPIWPRPVLNRPERIVRLAREQMSLLLEGIPGVVMPDTVRIPREALARIPETLLPLIVRTVGSHAGRGLMKIDRAADIAAYLANQPEPEFFVSPFVDYSSPDGLYRKYRIIWVDGRPFPVHMAIADEWKVWYLNAHMDESAAKRAEEAQFMTDFESGFGKRHAAALDAIAERFGLEYMGIDCGETRDGKLLVFEGDTALVAHDMDPPGLYPYKAPCMQKLFAAFYDMLRRKCGADFSPRGTSSVPQPRP